MNYNDIIEKLYQEESDEELEELEETDEEDLIKETWNEYNSNISIPELKIKLLEREEYIMIDSISRLDDNINTHPCNFSIKFGINDNIGKTNINRYENNTELISRRAINHLNNINFYTKDLVTIIEKVYGSNYTSIQNIYKNVVQLELIKITIPLLPNKVEYNNMSYNIYDKYNNYIFELENFNSNIQCNNNNINNVFSILSSSRLKTDYDNINLNNGFIDLYPIGNFAKYFKPTPLSKLDRLHLKLKNDNGNLLDTEYNDHIKIDYLDLDINNINLIIKTNEFSNNLFNIGDNITISLISNIDILQTIAEDNPEFNDIIACICKEDRYLLLEFINIYINDIHSINKMEFISNTNTTNKIYVKLPFDKYKFQKNGILEFDNIYNIVNQSVIYENETYSLLKLFSILITRYITDIYVINISKRYTYTFKIKYLIPDSDNLTINKFI